MFHPSGPNFRLSCEQRKYSALVSSGFTDSLLSYLPALQENATSWCYCVQIRLVDLVQPTRSLFSGNEANTQLTVQNVSVQGVVFIIFHFIQYEFWFLFHFLICLPNCFSGPRDIVDNGFVAYIPVHMCGGSPRRRALVSTAACWICRGSPVRCRRTFASDPPWCPVAAHSCTWSPSTSK